MTKIIFVCFGNICRSPMAEFVMKHLVDRAGLENDFLIESAGCHPSVGTPLSEGTAHELFKNNVPFKRRTSKLFLESDYERFDYIVGLDHSNVYYMKELCGGDPNNKISLLMEFAGERRSVDDPWYTNDYAASYRDILIGCKALLEFVKSGICQKEKQFALKKFFRQQAGIFVIRVEPPLRGCGAVG